MYFSPFPCGLQKKMVDVDDDKWDGRLVALGMAQGTYPMDNVTSAKFRIFLAERAINYLYIANTGANVLLTNTNIGCPNISFGPSNPPPPSPCLSPYRSQLHILNNVLLNMN